MAVAQDLATIQAFMSSLRKQEPPYSCFVCQKMYRSFSGMEYHLKEVGHDENGKERSKNVISRPMNNTPKKALASSRPKSRKSGGLKSSCASSPAPAKKETLTYSEAQRLVQVDVDGSLSRVSMRNGLGVVVANEPEARMETTDGANTQDEEMDLTCPPSTEISLNDHSICKSTAVDLGERENITDRQPEATAEGLNYAGGKVSDSPETCRKMPKRSCTGTKNVGMETVRSTPDVKKKQRRAASSGACTSALPVAVVRIIEPPCTSSTLADKSAYFRFIEKSNEELDEVVEYDMDEDDSEWLDGINARRKKDGVAPVSRETFELLMDRLEKESFFESRRDGSNGVDPALDEDAVCCICNDGEVQNSNAILFCDMCNLAVHQECYGVPFIPEGQWLCRRCLNSPSCAVDCALCPNKGGAFKQTDKGKWAHVVCALWIPEVQFANAVFLEPIDSIDEIPGARWRLTCYICHRRGGACIQCVNRTCYTAFHPTCAQHAGLYMKMEVLKKTDGDKTVPSIRKVVYCDVHSPQSGEEPSEDLSCHLTVGKAIVSKTAPRAPPSDLLKKKLQAERRLSALSAAPIVNIPFVADSKLADIAGLVSINKKMAFLQELRSFWALKRQSRSGVPLLRRLQASHQSQKSGLETETVAALKEQLVHWHRLRHDLERSRLLIELIRKREKLKREDLRMHQHMTDLQLQPLTVLLRRTLDQLQQKDVLKIFAEPVSVDEVPDYLEIIDQPMDFSTMRRKLDNHVYMSVSAFIEDFHLIHRNCMTYNAKDTVYFRAAVKIRDCGSALLRFARKQAEQAGIDPETGMHVEQDLDPEKLQQQLDQDLTLAEQLVELKAEHDEVKESSSLGKTARLRALRKQITVVKKKMAQEIVDKKIQVGVMIADGEPMDFPDGVTPSSKLKPQKRRSTGGGPRRKRHRASDLSNDAANSTTAESCPDTDDVEGDRPADLTMEDSETPLRIKSPDGAGRNGLVAGDSGARPQRQRKPSNRMRETDDFTLRCATVTRTSSREVVLDLPASPSSISPTGATPVSLSGGFNGQVPVAAGEEAMDTSSGAALVGSHPDPAVASRASNPVVSLPRIKRSPTSSSSDLAAPEEMDTSADGVVNGHEVAAGVATPRSFAAKSSASSPSSSSSASSSTQQPHENHPGSPKPSSSGTPPSHNSLSSPVGRKKRKPGRPRNPARHPSVTSLSSSDSTFSEEVFKFSNGHLRNCSDAEDGKPEESALPIELKPMDLVWAKCRGYPSYPAVIVDPAMTEEEGDFGCGYYVPLPPVGVLRVQRTDNDNLVLFFDSRRTWQWLPRSKLAPLGFRQSLDAEKLMECRKPGTRRSVSKAFDRALMHQLRSRSAKDPDSHALPPEDMLEKEDEESGQMEEEEEDEDS
ncbi:peregrin-like isoform X1 [Sycon ciliatum]|uniref:peregrin-like isoform X1 n=1 Tax=Sycon ciliatum TaxID=27933 RepID=UPI0031F66426